MIKTTPVLICGVITGVLTVAGIMEDTANVMMSPLGHLYPLFAYLSLQCVLIVLNSTVKRRAVLWGTVLQVLVGAGMALIVAFMANPFNAVPFEQMTRGGWALAVASNVLIVTVLAGGAWLLIRWNVQAHREGRRSRG